MDGYSSHRSSSSIECSSLLFDEEDNESPHVDILERFDSDDLMELRKFFFEEKLLSDNDEMNQSGSYKGHPLFRDEFVNSVDKVIGSKSYSVAAAKLFDKLSKENVDAGKEIIWWEQILDAVIEKIQIHDSEKASLKLIDDSNLNMCVLPHSKREVIVKIVLLDTEISFCYVAVSKYGLVGVYDGQLNLLESYKVHLGAQMHESIRSTSTWINDAVSLPDATAILVAASDRSLHFLTATGLVHTPMFLISGLPNSPQCLTYYTGKDNEPSLLFFGDDHGDITVMQFYQPHNSLFRRASSEKSNCYFWRDLEGQDEWVTISVDHSVHKAGVHQIEYIKDNNTVISSSNDPNATIVIRHFIGRRVPYIFKLTRGVRCFYLDCGLKLLATGSTDNIVRLWNPVVTKSPVGSLYGHKAAVVDVRILRSYNSALSVSSDGVLKVWDIEDHFCLQTIILNIPVFSVLGKKVEFGARTLYPGPSTAKPPLSRQPKTSPKSSLKASHPASLLSNTTPSSKPSLTFSEDTQWSRPHILMVCCNYSVLMPVTKQEYIEYLPPPQREKDPIVPSPWVRADAHTQLISPSDLNDHPPPDMSLKSPLSEPLEVISPRALKVLRQTPSEFKYQFKSLTSPSHGLNVSRAQQRAEEKHMKSMVEQCAPHLALKLHQPEEIKFSKDLPVTNRMKNLDLSTPEKLMKTKLKTDFNKTFLQSLSFNNDNDCTSLLSTSTLNGTKKKRK
ncbi:cilia- and flagella-associated protein 337-like [Lycorma delicatula]|uniref:cilia- and flagella-associated protein 337-like n=1 Tax=Lycorma delicatula TaxID=130591 RepID=UPI003F5147F7